MQVKLYKEITPDLTGVIIGMLMGDSNFGSARKRRYIATEHSTKQEEYLMWKFNKLKDVIGGGYIGERDLTNAQIKFINQYHIILLHIRL